ncbi:hypothetical protein [Zobellella aerophila]|uniref:Uncharacterized protein n=1 Tax=Zobellella aerophila TaxID=870480 RepID=A0ABP6VBG0_9GAMM
MKVKTLKQLEVITDVRCDVRGCSTVMAEGYSPQFGVLQAAWGYGSHHDGERFEVDLCESCFFGALAHLREVRRINSLFDDDWSSGAGSAELI